MSLRNLYIDQSSNVIFQCQCCLQNLIHALLLGSFVMLTCGCKCKLSMLFQVLTNYKALTTPKLYEYVNMKLYNVHTIMNTCTYNVYKFMN